MPISMRSNIASLRGQRQLATASGKLSQVFERLSSGQRINRASDDAAGLAVASSLNVDSRLTSRALKNVNDGISMLAIAQGALGAQQEVLMRMSELAEQAANGTYSREQRNLMQKEYSTLQEEFDRVASSAKFNGISLLRNRTPAQIQFMAGINGADESLLTFAAVNSHRFAGETAITSDLNGDGTIDGFDLGTGANFLGATLTSDSNITAGAVLQGVDSSGQELTIRFHINRMSADWGPICATSFSHSRQS